MTPGLIGNHVFATMQGADFDLLQPLMEETMLAHEIVLNEPGSLVEVVHFPVGAVLSVVTMMREGQSVESCTIGHESAYGLLNTLGSPCAMDRILVQVPGPAFHVTTARLKRAAAEIPALTELLVRHVQSTTTQTEQSVACNAVHPTEARLCRWLLMSQDRTDNGVLPLTQEFLAFMLGVQRTSVTIAARALQAAGLIHYHRGQIEIRDRAGLEDGACECYAAVRAKQDLLFRDYPRLR